MTVKYISEKNRFFGDVVTMWLKKEPRKMQLTESFTFIDPKGKKWTAPQGAIIDGASIPRALWVFTGSPFVGLYRAASVIHDHYCVTKSEPHKNVHKMFYDAMIASGVSKFKAKKMYFAVKLGGPKWKS